MAEQDKIDRGDELETEKVENQVEGEEQEVEEEGKLANSDQTEAEEGEETEEERLEREREERNRRIRIPKKRFDEAIQKARAREAALQQKIADLEGKLGVNKQEEDFAKVQQEIDKLQDQYEDALMEGRKSEAKELRVKLDRARDMLIETKTTAKSEAAKRAAIEELRYDSLLANLEAAHPEMNPDSDEFDEARTDEVAQLMDAFRRQGYTASAALQRATRYVFGDPQQAQRATASSDLRTARTVDARRRAAAAAAAQPAPAGKAVSSTRSASDTNVDVMRLTTEQFAKLDEATKRRLRGDDL